MSVDATTDVEQITAAAPQGRLSKSPARQAAVLAVATGVSQILLAGMFAVAARLSSPYEFGLLGTAYAIGLVGASLIDFGTNSLWLREVVAGRLPAAEIRARTAGKMLVAIVGASAVTVAVLLAAPGSALALSGPLLFCIALAQSAQVPLRARLRSDLVGAFALADRLVALIVFSCALLVPGVDAVVALGAAVCSGLVVEAVLAIRCHPAPRLWGRPRNPYSGARHFGLSSLANSAQSLDVVFISALGGPAQAGLFSAVNRWTAPMGLLVSAFTSATTPFVARSSSIRTALPQLRSALWMPCGAVVCCVVLAVTAPFTVTALLGDAYADSASVLQVLALAVVPAIAAQPLSTYLQALGHDRSVSIALTSVVLVQLLAVVGAAVAGGVVLVAAVIALGQLAMAVVLGLIAARAWQAAPRRGPDETRGE